MNNNPFIHKKLNKFKNMGKLQLCYIYGYDNMDSKTMTLHKDRCICKKSPTSSEVCGLTDATGGPPGPDMITVPPCITLKKKGVMNDNS